MAIRPEDEYVNTTPADASYPGGSFKNETAPLSLDGTPLEKKWTNDIQGVLQKLLNAASITASGVPDTIINSDYYDALVAILGFNQVYYDTGIANAYELGLRSGAAVEGYQDGQVITFVASNTNTGACTAQIDALGAKDITYPDGSPLLGGEILDGSFISAIYYSAGDQFELWVWVPAAYNSVMTGNETFIYPYQKERVSTLDGGVLARTYNPLGTFPNGAKEVVVNVGATDNVIFDSGGLSTTINPGENVSFVFNGTSGSWEILEQPFAGVDIGTFVNNANGNPNISDSAFLTSSIAALTWESVGPTGSGADNIWAILDVVPGDVDWIRIRAYIESEQIGGSANVIRRSIIWTRRTGSAELDGTSNIVIVHKTHSSSAGNASAETMSELTIGVDSSIRFDVRWQSLFSTTFSGGIFLAGWGYND